MVFCCDLLSSKYSQVVRSVISPSNSFLRQREIYMYVIGPAPSLDLSRSGAVFQFKSFTNKDNGLLTNLDHPSDFLPTRSATPAYSVRTREGETWSLKHTHGRHTPQGWPQVRRTGPVRLAVGSLTVMKLSCGVLMGDAHTDLFSLFFSFFFLFLSSLSREFGGRGGRTTPPVQYFRLHRSRTVTNRVAG